MKTILMTGAGGTASRNVIECLRLSGEEFRIIGSDIQRYHIMLNDLQARYLIPAFADDWQNYINAVNDICTKEGVEFIHPQPDIEVYGIARNHGKLAARTRLPDLYTITTCQDKLNCNSILAAKGIPVPLSEGLYSPEGALTTVRNFLRWNDKVWLRTTKGAGSKAATPIYSAEEAIGWMQTWAHKIGADLFMVSEYLPGKDYCWTSLWADGELITSMTRQRLMYLFGFTSPSGQSSTPSVAVTVHNRKVNEVCKAAIEALDARANGIFTLDLKENAKGVPCITEINPGRFNTTINFFAHAGINFPYLHTKLAYGEEIQKISQFDVIPKGLYWVRQIGMGYRLFNESGFAATDYREKVWQPLKV